MTDRAIGDEDAPSVTAGALPDGGEDDGDRRDEEDREATEAPGGTGGGEGGVDKGSGGGFWPWSGRRRIRRLRRELDEVRSERDDLQADVEGLQDRLVEMETELEELRGTVETVGRRTFPVSEFLRSVADSAWRADRGLAGSEFGVGNVEVTLRSRFAGADEGLSVQLPDPDEDIDPETLSTITFQVDRGVSRGDLPGGLLMSGARIPGGPDAAGAGGEGDEDDGPSEPSGDEYLEVPDVRELSLDGARDELSDAGFDAVVEYRPEATPEGSVIEQHPEPFSYGPRGAEIHLVVAGRGPEA